MRPSRDPHARKPLRLLALGGAALVDASGTVVAGQRRRVALLVLLAAGRGVGVSRDKLVALLSPESSTESARHALQQLVYYLRQQAGEDVFLGTDPLRLNPDVLTSDIADFEDAIERGALADAVALYRGPFLDGFHLPDSVEFDEWAAREGARLAGRYGDAVHAMALSASARGDHLIAVDCWRRLAALDPLGPSTALGLMRALVAAGDRRAAVRHARAHEAILLSELGASADPDVSALAADLERSAAHPPPVVPRPASPTARDRPRLTPRLMS